MKNNIWLVGFLAKKKLLWLTGIVLAVYFILLPYQRNLLLYADGCRDVKKVFWDTACLYHGVLSLTFVFQGMCQLMNTEVGEMTGMYSGIRKYAAAGFVLIYELMAMPVYIWYISVSSGDVGRLGILLLVHIMGIVLFWVIAKLADQVMAAYVIVLMVYIAVF